MADGLRERLVERVAADPAFQAGVRAAIAVVSEMLVPELHGGEIGFGLKPEPCRLAGIAGRRGVFKVRGMAARRVRARLSVRPHGYF